MICCGKNICFGCTYKQTMTDIRKGKPKGEGKCAFCCQPTPKNAIKALKKLMKKNISAAYTNMAEIYRKGSNGVLQSNTKSLEMYIRAAELGNVGAYGVIASFFRKPDVDVYRTRFIECIIIQINLNFWKLLQRKNL